MSQENAVGSWVGTFGIDLGEAMFQYPKAAVLSARGRVLRLHPFAVMKNFWFFVGILVMAGLNWTDITHVTYSSERVTKSASYDYGAYPVGLANLFGIALAALLLSEIYQRLRRILDRGIVTYPRFRIPASAKLFPHRSAYVLLLAFVWGRGWTRTFPGKDSLGSFIATEKWSFGSQCSGGPFWLAVLCITLWNFLQAMTPPPPSEGVVGLAAHEA